MFRRILFPLFLLLFLSFCLNAEGQRPDGVEQCFIYESAPFPSCHASTIVELQNGDLLAAWFGGEYEGHPDVKIWVSRKYFGASRWTTPQVAADGTFAEGSEQARLAGLDSTDHGRKACYNPVLFQMPDGEVLLFYKIGRFVQDWSGWLVRSRDNGQTWSKHEPLPEGFLGPVKNKPVVVGNRLLCPSSTEKDGWKIHFEAYGLDAAGHFPDAASLSSRATIIGPVEAEQAEKTFEPGIQSPIGCTWTPVQLTDLPNNNSGTDAVTLRDGRQLLVYNPTATQPGQHNAPRTPLCVAISDDGRTWRHLVTLEDSSVGEYSYPAVIQGRDGTVHITYTWRRELIRYARLNI